MRCLSCDCELNDFESTRKHKVTGEYIDMCTRCFKTVLDVQPIPVKVNRKLMHTQAKGEEDE